MAEVAQPEARGTAVIFGFGSLLLVLVAVALLAYGLLHGSNGYLIGSVAASLLAAVTLIAGGRQAARTAGEEQAEAEPEAEPGAAGASGPARRPGRPVVIEDPVEPGEPAGSEPAPEQVEALVGAGLRGQPPGADPGVVVPAAADRPSSGQRSMVDDDDDYGDDDPPDEPPPQLVSPADAARVARMNDEVLVIDGRPRYHWEGCVHLLGRQVDPLPVSEAIDLGFTPCSRCEPDSKLLAPARRI